MSFVLLVVVVAVNEEENLLVYLYCLFYLAGWLVCWLASGSFKKGRRGERWELPFRAVILFRYLADLITLRWVC